MDPERQGKVDASQITSKPCFEAWHTTRVRVHPFPERAYLRTLVAHVSATDGRNPFSEAEEAAVLLVLRDPTKMWACLKEPRPPSRTKGFHEKGVDRHHKKHKPVTDTPATTLTATEEEDEVNDYPATRLLRALFATMVGAETWERCWGVIHYMSITKLKWVQRPTMEQAGAFLETIQAEFPDHYVAIFDSTERDLKYRVMLQDPKAIEFFGPMARGHGGTDHTIIHYTDFFQVSVAVVKALNPVGRRDVVLPKLNLLTWDGSWKQFAVRAITCADSRCLAQVGILSDQ
jgi:hypothetical protein